MELKKTTVISALVCIAGLLAEIIFCDIMSKSVFGVILSIILAVVILTTAFFVIDGIRTFCLLEQQKNLEREKEYEQRLYGVLNEQLQFQKEIYRGVYSTQSPDNLFEEEAAASEENTQSSEELIQAINDNTMTAAKTVARYVNKSTTDIKEMAADNHTDVVRLLQTIESNQNRLLALAEELKEK
ncbi:MAG: hypothetical protein SO170_08810 [Butyribacter sp.]|nr:hypothetical protein [bacterium]MDY3855038.1 hypothetical protein [Butyribacter sp.]